MKQTAVEWFVEQLASIRKQNSGYRNIEIELKELIEQAKAMEKEQIMSAFMQGDIFGADYYDGVNPTDENYYNQTFKSE